MAFAGQLHVNGTAQIWTTGAGSLNQLGVSVDGVTIKINNEFEPVYTDAYGPKVPFDTQYFLQSATIECDLIYWDKAELKLWLTSIPLGGNTLGTMYFAGDLAVQSNLTARVLIKSIPSGAGLTAVEDCWNFPLCVLVDSAEVKLGVKVSVWKLTWQALVAQQASGSDNAVLWNTTCS